MRQIRGLVGVYAIRDAATKEVLYVGRGSRCLKAALVRHFHSWTPSRWHPLFRRTYDRAAVEVKVWRVRDPEWVFSTEVDLIALLKPRDNERMEAVHRTLEDAPF